MIVVNGNSDLFAYVVNGEQDMLTREEASAFEVRIGDLHPREGGLLWIVGRFIQNDGDINRSSGFAACFKIGLSHSHSPL